VATSGGIPIFSTIPSPVETVRGPVEAGALGLAHDSACVYDFMAGNPFFADEHQLGAPVNSRP
jgi:hypothetical protein